MKRTLLFVLINIFIKSVGYGQIFPRWTSSLSKRCIFLKSIDSLCPQLIYYDLPNDSPSIIEIKGYAMDEDNFKNNHDLKIILSECRHPKDTMTIFLHFEHVPDSVNYYLEIPHFDSGRTIEATVPKKVKKIIYIADGKKRPKIQNKKFKWPQMPVFDITNIVFTENIKKKN